VPRNKHPVDTPIKASETDYLQRSGSVLLFHFQRTVSVTNDSAHPCRQSHTQSHASVGPYTLSSMPGHASRRGARVDGVLFVESGTVKLERGRDGVESCKAHHSGYHHVSWPWVLRAAKQRPLSIKARRRRSDQGCPSVILTSPQQASPHLPTTDVSSLPHAPIHRPSLDLCPVTTLRRPIHFGHGTHERRTCLPATPCRACTAWTRSQIQSGAALSYRGHNLRAKSAVDPHHHLQPSPLLHGLPHIPSLLCRAATAPASLCTRARLLHVCTSTSPLHLDISTAADTAARLPNRCSLPSPLQRPGSGY